MNEEDRVFARFKGNKPEASGRREQLTIPGRAGTSGSRVVEVVHVRSNATMKDRPRHVDTRVRAAPWDGSFLAKQTAAGAVPVQPMAAESAKPVRHIVAKEELPSVETGGAPLPSVGEPVVATLQGRGRPHQETPYTPTRRIADPFDAGDDGANCLRCGYSIETKRQKRGLMTCSECG
ncbi:hypothetical protein [Sediminicoccus rosea]|uniref:Uncharacterized protein n=1 Tax=Sediminicoccus rosea TaxID=1225128 RepID=A0ABZ0PEF2_9PROT|nr:hypothetical protein [Sediminicoccus rosea]WPB83738.1 hypothetical protein R9Z33_16675 [Sediminicoccus rosea]